MNSEGTGGLVDFCVMISDRWMTETHTWMLPLLRMCLSSSSHDLGSFRHPASVEPEGIRGILYFFKVPSSWLVFREVGLELNPRCQQIVDMASPILRCRFVDVHIFRNNHELTIMNMINSNHLKSAPLPPKSGTCRCTRIFGASTQLLGGLVKL